MKKTLVIFATILLALAPIYAKSENQSAENKIRKILPQKKQTGKNREKMPLQKLENSLKQLEMKLGNL